MSYYTVDFRTECIEGPFTSKDQLIMFLSNTLMGDIEITSSYKRAKELSKSFPQPEPDPLDDYDNDEMTKERAKVILMDQLHDSERKDWEANGCPDDHCYVALLTLAGEI